MKPIMRKCAAGVAAIKKVGLEGTEAAAGAVNEGTNGKAGECVSAAIGKEAVRNAEEASEKNIVETVRNAGGAKEKKAAGEVREKDIVGIARIAEAVREKKAAGIAKSAGEATEKEAVRSADIASGM